MGIKRTDIDLIYRRLNDSKTNLQLGKIHSCLVSFKDALDKMTRTNMLMADERALMDEITAFQKKLAESQDFRDLFGPVSFHEGDKATVLQFVSELITVEEEEILARMKDAQDPEGLPDSVSLEKIGPLVEELINDGNTEKALKIIGSNELLRDWLVNRFNSAGIGFRKKSHHDEAAEQFRKAILVDPEDECLYYNFGRANLEKGNLGAAREALQRAMEINKDFREGMDLLGHIDRIGKKV